MRKGNIIKKIVILVLILLVPGFLYYLLTAKGKNRYKPLPVYGDKLVAKTGHTFHGKFIPDTIYHVLPDFKLTDQDGKEVSLKDFDGKIFVANFFYIHCPNVCSTVNGYMDSLAHVYEKNKLVKFVSITVDPQADNVPALKSYAQKFQLPASKWAFLTGDTSVIYPLAHKGFLVDAGQTKPGEFIFRDLMILIDSHKRIRGYYSGTTFSEIGRIDDEIKVQITEELRSKDTPLY